MNLITLTVPIWSAAAVVLLTATAALSDMRTRRIPNVLTLPALALALVAHAIDGGVGGLGRGVGGMLVAGGLLLPGWWLGWMGAGDVKLMAAVGAWVAYPASLMAVLASLIAGGVISILVAVRHRTLGRALRSAAWIGAWAAGGAGRGNAPPATTGLRFPFATAILAGSWMALWIRL